MLCYRKFSDLCQVLYNCFEREVHIPQAHRSEVWVSLTFMASRGVQVYVVTWGLYPSRVQGQSPGAGSQGQSSPKLTIILYHKDELAPVFRFCQI